MEIKNDSTSQPLFIQFEASKIKDKEIAIELANHIEKMNDDLKSLLFLISGKGVAGKKGNLTDILS